MVALMLWWPKCMEICLFRGVSSSKIAPAAPCFCFLNRGPGPSKAASEGPQTERSKNLRPGPETGASRSSEAARLALFAQAGTGNDPACGLFSPDDIKMLSPWKPNFSTSQNSKLLERGPRDEGGPRQGAQVHGPPAACCSLWPLPSLS